MYLDQKVREAADPLLEKIVKLTDYFQKLEEHVSELSKEVDDVNQQGRKEYLILDGDAVPKFSEEEDARKVAVGVL